MMGWSPSTGRSAHPYRDLTLQAAIDR